MEQADSKNANAAYEQKTIEPAQQNLITEEKMLAKDIATDEHIQAPAF